MAAVAYPLAGFDPMDLGGVFLLRLVLFVAAVGAGYVTSRAVMQARRASARGYGVLAGVGLGAATFTATAVLVLGLLLVASLALA